jgi:hypothetical protein
VALIPNDHGFKAMIMAQLDHDEHGRQTAAANVAAASVSH